MPIGTTVEEWTLIAELVFQDEIMFPFGEGVLFPMRSGLHGIPTC